MPCDEGSEHSIDSIRITAYHYKAHQLAKKGSVLADTFVNALALNCEDSFFGGPKPCVLCGSVGMTHFADHGRPVNCNAKVLLGVAEFKVTFRPLHSPGHPCTLRGRAVDAGACNDGSSQVKSTLVGDFFVSN